MKQSPKFILLETFVLSLSCIDLILKSKLRLLINRVNFMRCGAKARNGMRLDFVNIEYIFTGRVGNLPLEASSLLLVLHV